MEGAEWLGFARAISFSRSRKWQQYLGALSFAMAVAFPHR